MTNQRTAESYHKWLLGCGIGCAAVIVLVIAIGLAGYFAAKHAVEDFKEIARTVEEVEKQHGAPTRYTPEPGGRIPADRMEAFLEVRRATSPVRAEIRSELREFEHQVTEAGKSGRSGFWGAIKMARRGVGVIPKVAAFHRQRAEGLLRGQMGLGEYQYIYFLSYYSWLKKDPSDGPRHIRMGGNNTVNWDPRNDPDDARESRRLRVVREMRRSVQAMLRNAQQSESGPGAQNRRWLRSVETELIALDSEWSRIPWQDGLPIEIQESLEPFRAELEEAYDSLMNAIELLPLDDR
jgi:hypothetical protein